MSTPKKDRPRPSRSAERATEDSSSERLQKVLAAAGFGSRRDCESLITEGRVEVDGEVTDTLGTRVDPSQQTILVDGERIKVGRKEYFMINKPTGVLSTNWDPSGRIRVIDLIPTGQRVFTVGRLDKSSEGMILVTNDGTLAQRLTHPSYGIEKIYEVVVAGHPTTESLKQLTQGVRLAEGWARAKNIRVRRRLKSTAVLEMVLDEGRNREIRRLLARIGHKVIRLKRIAIGRIRLGELQPGESRALTREEVRELRRATARKPSGRPSGKPSGSPSQKQATDKQTGRNAARGEDSRPARPKSGSAQTPSRGPASGSNRPAKGTSRTAGTQGARKRSSQRPATPGKKTTSGGRSAASPGAKRKTAKRTGPGGRTPARKSGGSRPQGRTRPGGGRGKR